MSLRSGDLIHDRYRIEAPLGSTETATAYRAFDTLQGQPCLLEVFALAPPGPASESAPAGDAALPLTVHDRALDHFMREARLLARLGHPHIPAVIEYFGQGDAGYLALAWVEGRDLADILAQQARPALAPEGKSATGGPWPVAQVMEWADQLLAALAYCHAHGVVHRDVRPANILVTPANWIYLVGFGLSGLGPAPSPYSPPERRYGVAGARGDIYALGATLYALLTGQEPPTALQRQAGEPLPSPRALTGGAVSAGLAAWLVRAMALDPGGRFQSAGEMRLILNRVRQDDIELAALFAAASAACRHGRWSKAERLLSDVVRQQPDYTRHGVSAADLLAQAQSRRGQRPPWLVWVGAGVPILALATFSALEAAHALRLPGLAVSTPTATLTLTAASTASPTLVVISQPSPTPETPTATATATTTPTATATHTATRKPTVRPTTKPSPTATPAPPSPTPEAEEATPTAPAPTETPAAETPTVETLSPSPAPGAGSSPSPPTTP